MTSNSAVIGSSKSIPNLTICENTSYKILKFTKSKSLDLAKNIRHKDISSKFRSEESIPNKIFNRFDMPCL